LLPLDVDGQRHAAERATRGRRDLCIGRQLLVGKQPEISICRPKPVNDAFDRRLAPLPSKRCVELDGSCEIADPKRDDSHPRGDAHPTLLVIRMRAGYPTPPTFSRRSARFGLRLADALAPPPGRRPRMAAWRSSGVPSARPSSIPITLVRARTAARRIVG